MYNLLIWIGIISNVLMTISLTLSMGYAIEKKDKLSSFFGSSSIMFVILIILALCLTSETDKITLVATHKIYSIKEQPTWGKLTMYYILDTSNGRYKINNAVYKRNGEMSLEIYRKHCPVGKIDGKYYYIINK